ncbi:OmpA family protein [Aquimarina algiphila]|uniref:OmpA family protein n=1 Tax=Aquimarina algiphila TaxID=2047982 RepID=UPI002491CDA0|nr:OmpA family protein [Aquimarina algiphila]
MKKICILILLGTTFLHAQKDIAGSKDSELLTRYPESWIIQYSQSEYEQFKVALDKNYPEGKSKVAEGKYTSIDYKLPNGKSQLELHKNYESALSRKGYEILFSCYQQDCNPLQGSFSSIPYVLFQEKRLANLATGGNAYRKNSSTYLVAEKEVNGRTITITVMSGFESYANVYRIDIIESKPLDLSKVSIKDIDHKLNEEGSIALYGICFDFNSDRLKPESKNTIKLLADFLKQNTMINVYIVGHTDNIGDYKTNFELSEKRAKAVVNELISKYNISSNRLLAKGVAMLSPVTSNNTKEGRKLNRRVEIVKQ